MQARLARRKLRSRDVFAAAHGALLFALAGTRSAAYDQGRVGELRQPRFNLSRVPSCLDELAGELEFHLADVVDLEVNGELLIDVDEATRPLELVEQQRTGEDPSVF